MAQLSRESRRHTGSKRGAPRRFLPILWELLMDEETQDVIRWSSGGKTFHVLDPYRFEEHVGLKYFKHARFSSFQRQLNLYGFKKIDGNYYHENFNRKNPENVRLITRETQHRSLNEFATNAYLDTQSEFEISADSMVIGAGTGVRIGKSKGVSSLGIHDAPEESDECFMEGVHLDPVRASFQKGLGEIFAHDDGPTVDMQPRVFDGMSNVNPLPQLSCSPRNSFSLLDEVKKMEAARFLSVMGSMPPSFHTPMGYNQDVFQAANNLTMEEVTATYVTMIEGISSDIDCSTEEDRNQIQEAFQCLAQREHSGNYEIHWKQGQCEPRVIVDVNAISVNDV